MADPKNIPCTYIVRCADDTLYTGWTNGLEERIEAHNQGIGAKYTRGRGPVTLVYVEYFSDKIDAMKRETEIKRCSRKTKIKIIALECNQLNTNNR